MTWMNTSGSWEFRDFTWEGYISLLQIADRAGREKSRVLQLFRPKGVARKPGKV